MWKGRKLETRETQGRDAGARSANRQDRMEQKISGKEDVEKSCLHRKVHKKTAQSPEPWRQGKGDECAHSCFKAEGKEKHREFVLKIRSVGYPCVY